MVSMRKTSKRIIERLIKMVDEKEKFNYEKFNYDSNNTYAFYNTRRYEYMIEKNSKGYIITRFHDKWNLADNETIKVNWYDALLLKTC